MLSTVWSYSHANATSQRVLSLHSVLVGTVITFAELFFQFLFCSPKCVIRLSSCLSFYCTYFILPFAWFYDHPLKIMTHLGCENIIWLPLWSSGRSSWLQIQRSRFNFWLYQIFWEVVGLERGPLSLEYNRPPLWSSGQSSWLQIQRSGFDIRRYQIFWEVVGLERGPLSLVSTIDRLCGLVVRVRGHRSRGLGSIPDATRFSEK
jgi:hypothetical protein